MKALGLFAIVSVAALSGCASITGDSAQSIRVETRLTDGAEVRDADCEISNDYGSYRMKSPGMVTVHRSSKDLNITCKKEGLPDALATSTSRANAGMFGNIIFGGGVGVGAIIDHSKGTAYTYPQWLQVVFGKMLSFDRSDDNDGKPSVAKEPGQAAEKQAATSQSAGSI